MSYRLDEAAFGDWLEAYKTAWEARDAAAAADLFAAEATYHEMPFDAPIAGAEAIAAYWARAVAGQKDIGFTYEILACTGDQGLCHWHCAFTAIPGGERIDLDGIFRCRFADAAHVDRFQEWWHVRTRPALDT
jgi:ketosteroid isomerase-like protein